MSMEHSGFRRRHFRTRHDPDGRLGRQPAHLAGDSGIETSEADRWDSVFTSGDVFHLSGDGASAANRGFDPLCYSHLRHHRNGVLQRQIPHCLLL